MIITPNKFGLIVFSGVGNGGTDLTILTEPALFIGRQVTIKRIYLEYVDAEGVTYRQGIPFPSTTLSLQQTYLLNSKLQLTANGMDIINSDMPVLFDLDNLFLTIPGKLETITAKVEANNILGGSVTAFDVKLFIECYFDLFTNDKTV